MLIALVKLGGPSTAGQFTLALALCSPAFVLANLQLRGIQATDATAEYLVQDYLALRLVTTLLALAAVSSIAFASGNRGTALLVVVAVACAKGIEAGSDLLFGYLQKHERMDRVAASLMLKGVLSILAVYVGYIVWHSLFAAVCLMCGVWVALLAGFDLVNCMRARGLYRDYASRFRPRFDAGRLKGMAVLLAPVGIAMMLNSLTANVPRYAIEHHSGRHILGLFGGLCYIQAAAITLAAAMGQASGPRLAHHYSAGDKRAFIRLLAHLLGVVGVAGAIGTWGAWLGGSRFLATLYTQEYGRYAFELLLLMLAAAVGMQVAVLNDCALAMRLMRPQVLIFAATLACTVLGCALMVGRYGLRGVAVAILLASVVQLAATAALVGIHLRRPWPVIIHL
jgi:O-antigen/teichoic acid export membrane protein